MWRWVGLSDGLLLQDVDAAGRAQTDDVGEADLGVGDLAVAGLAPEVGGDLVAVGDAGGADGVALGDEAIAGVDGRAADSLRRAGHDELYGASLFGPTAKVVVN